VILPWRAKVSSISANSFFSFEKEHPQIKLIKEKSRRHR